MIEKPGHCVYVRVRSAFRAGLRTEQVTDTVALDWESADGDTERLVGVEVLDARGVEVDGIPLDRLADGNDR